MTLYNWVIIRGLGGHFVAVGDIYGDVKGRFEDGTRITTSYITLLDVTENTVHTRNSKYILG